MKTSMLPQSTPYDPAEDLPGSVDPLGTVTGAEQLAEVLLPGLTARMWRARHLTFAVLAAEIAKRVATGREDRFVEARLAFERIFVSAIARQENNNTGWGNASRRLPGIGLARRALGAGDQPLERASFLKGPAVNGPFGVVARLARDMGLVDEAGEVQSAGTTLLSAWADDEGLPGLLDDDRGRDGAEWLKKLVKQVAACCDDRESSWPRPHWLGWIEVAERLRPDRLRSRERNAIKSLLSRDPLGIRERVIQKLAEPELVAVYRQANAEWDRGGVERQVIVRGFVNATASDDIGRTLHATSNLVDAYEKLSGLLESVFRGLLQGLTRNSGQATREDVVQDPTLSPFLDKTRSQIGSAAVRFQQRLAALEADSLAAQRRSVDIDRMHKLLEEATAASSDTDACVSAVMDRHVRVQKEKNKGVWIEDGRQWTLMPGFGDTADEPQWYEGYLHPYRVTNIYSMLADLKAVPQSRIVDGEKEVE